MDRSKIVLSDIEPLKWGSDCHAWFLLDKKNMCVLHEEMPPNTSEELHFHTELDQFFYVVSGELGVTIDQETFSLKKKEGIFIPHKSIHKVFNNSAVKVEFILFTTANPKHDRTNV